MIVFQYAFPSVIKLSARKYIKNHSRLELFKAAESLQKCFLTLNLFDSNF